MKRAGCTEMIDKSQQAFLYSAAFITLLTGCAKIRGAFQHLPVLFAVDPILGVSYRKIMLYIGVVELVIFSIIIFSGNNHLKLYLVSWLGSCFLTYRVFYKIGHVREPCPCLGTLTEWMHITRGEANLLLNIVSIWLCGFGLFFILYKSRREPHIISCNS
jgi:hypothetical protein